jgi:CheY-like chemotaxis protein
MKEELKARNGKRDACTDRGAPDFSALRILLAEDVEINREIFFALLGETRITIDSAENGRAAVETFAGDPLAYDLIIMDIQMPEMDGYEATKTIRALDAPNAKTIPIIALTANAFKEDIERCIVCGMNDHLSKPIDEKMVIEKIKRYAKKG